MTAQMLFQNDRQVSEWTAAAFQVPVGMVNMAIGIHDGQKLTGSVLFNDFNGSNVEISVFGKGVLTRGIIKTLAVICLKHFNVNRLSVKVLKKRKKFIWRLMKLGFRVEGVSRKYYGPTNAESAVRLVIFRDGLQRLAGLK